MCGLEALQRNTTRGLLIVQGNPSKLFLQSSKKHDDIRGLSDGVLFGLHESLHRPGQLWRLTAQ